MKLIFTLLLIAISFPALAENNDVLHIYSSRHYNTDQALYDNFTKLTGIRIERVDAKGDALITRLVQEGENSPADLFITVDAGRLWRAQDKDLFQSVDSKILNDKVPVNFQDKEKVAIKK